MRSSQGEITLNRPPKPWGHSLSTIRIANQSLVSSRGCIWEVKLHATTLDAGVLNNPHLGKELGHSGMGEATLGAPGQDLFHCGPQFQRAGSEAGCGNRSDPQACSGPWNRSAQHSLEMLWVGGKSRPKSQELHLLVKGSFPIKATNQDLGALGRLCCLLSCQDPRFLQPTRFASLSSTAIRCVTLLSNTG